eukprot:TRINITY_DN15603_c0_g1_i1.p1 TRINITY_DN15603_c0_g1~~TRINITY_DN15603_c0_g1_i1.p1  ORF type:complete len:370 (+),score=97.77 TRINITY_DN15603_c0_g1_i1:242-1351(+)
MGNDADLLMEEVVELRGFRGSAQKKDPDAVVVRGIPDPCRERNPTPTVRKQYRYPGGGAGSGSPTAAAQATQPFAACKWPLIIALIFWILPVILSPTVPCPIDGQSADYGRTAGSGLLAVQDMFMHKSGAGFVTSLRGLTDLHPVPQGEAGTQGGDAEGSREKPSDEPADAHPHCRASGYEYESWRTQTLVCAMATSMGWFAAACVVGYMAYSGMRVLPGYSAAMLCGVSAAAAASAASIADFIFLSQLMPRYNAMQDDTLAATLEAADAQYLPYAASYAARHLLLCSALLVLALLAKHHSPPLDLYAYAMYAPAALMLLPVVYPSPETSRLLWLGVSTCVASLVSFSTEYTAHLRKPLSREQATGMLS